MAEFFASHEALPGWTVFLREWAVARIQKDRAYVNAAAWIRLGENPEASLDELVFAFRAAGKGAGFWITPASSPRQLPALLRSRDFRLRRKFPAMRRALSGKIPRFATDGWEIAEIEASNQPPNAALLAAVHKGRKLGSCLVSLGAETAGLHDVEVAASHRNRGIGTSLVLAACSFAQDRGRNSIGLLSAALAENVYGRCGFVEVGRFDYWYSALTA